ncbi:MAG: hypothetical protein EOO40_04010, partial [Deltaproteobacteria bacterium]
VQVQRRMQRFASRPALAERQSPGPYRSHSYQAIWGRVVELATAWQHQQMVRPQDMVGILGFASIDWVVADLAVLHRCATSVPLRTGMSDADLAYIIAQTELRCVVCSVNNLPQLRRVLPHCPSVRYLVSMDAAEGAAPPQPTGGPPLATLEALLAAGRRLPPAPPMLPGNNGIPDDPLICVVYTSGSTGRPKGAMFPESLYRDNMLGLFGILPNITQISLGFLPLNHVAGRSSLYHTLMQGGLVCFVEKSDMSTLLDDAQAARPTTMMVVPRIAEMLYDSFRRQVMQRGSLQDGELCQAVMAQMRRHTLGDRLVMLLTGTAPTPPKIVAFLRNCFAVPVYDGYGATENGIVAFDHKIVRPTVRDYRLVDVPELGYSSQDKPYPRGELQIKSDRVIPGYFKNKEASAKLRSDDGFMRTGDIVEERGPELIFVIDRRNNIVKLSQGEFVSIAHLEGVYTSGSPLIAQIYLHGEAVRSYLLAVIVPDRQTLISQHGCVPPAAVLQDILRQELERVAKQAQLHPFEVPRAFVSFDSCFSKENGLLTESEKPARPQLLRKFSSDFVGMHQRLEQAQRAAQKALQQARGLPLADQVQQAAQACLGSEHIALHHSFVHAGGDSLSAVRLCETLAEVCGTAPPVAMALDPNTTLQTIVDYLA